MCRSPMAEALIRQHLSEVGVAAEVSSAGLLQPGHGAAPEVVEILSERGLDVVSHRSRRLSRGLIEDADLVLAMARDHLREAVLLAPKAFGRVFTFKELVRRGEAAPPPAGMEREEWLGLVGAGRQPRNLLGSAGDDDIADPIGGPLSDFRLTLAELDDLSSRLATLLSDLG
jgi:protein-tyrosine phosphatase